MRRDAKVLTSNGFGFERHTLRFTLVYEGARMSLRIFEAGRGCSKRAKVTKSCSVLWQGSPTHCTDVGVIIYDPALFVRLFAPSAKIRLFELLKIVLLDEAERAGTHDNVVYACTGYSRVFRWARQFEIARLPDEIRTRILEAHTP